MHYAATVLEIYSYCAAGCTVFIVLYGSLSLSGYKSDDQPVLPLRGGSLCHGVEVTTLLYRLYKENINLRYDEPNPSVSARVQLVWC